jgi:hypothetical protein
MPAGVRQRPRRILPFRQQLEQLARSSSVSFTRYGFMAPHLPEPILLSAILPGQPSSLDRIRAAQDTVCFSHARRNTSGTP